MSPNFANSNSVVIVAIIFDNKSCVQHYRQTEMAAGIAQARQILKGDNMVGERKKKKHKREEPVRHLCGQKLACYHFCITTDF